MKLTELEPIMEDWTPNARGYQYFTFLCPTCRKLRIRHAIWSHPPGEVRWKDAGGNDRFERVWQATQGPLLDWDTLSLSPSLNTPPHKRAGEQCHGWHGHIINGEVS
ncbi:hypothetical protein [Mesorhizobium silamurunense]|uniref:hypothetical protein n=1 Tax=Mesorhizobium silamurunense TaxID=499528 RepID=UPI00177D214E|nr:hypothetical protein [Mesorhizobium silamurunense]